MRKSHNTDYKKTKYKYQCYPHSYSSFVFISTLISSVKTTLSIFFPSTVTGIQSEDSLDDIDDRDAFSSYNVSYSIPAIQLEQ